jgi:hypothetical protein
MYEVKPFFSKYKSCFIHYGAFSAHRHLDEWNVGLPSLTDLSEQAFQTG